MTDQLCAINHIKQQARQDALDAAYEADGRNDPNHPMHALYTGLMVAPDWRALCQELLYLLETHLDSEERQINDVDSTITRVRTLLEQNP